MTPSDKLELILQTHLLEAQISRSNQMILHYEHLLLKYSQHSNRQVGSYLIEQTTVQLLAERSQYQALLDQLTQNLAN